ncbi:MAG: EscU/YscU/HrcU family type III secretion system export apparatus switch protein [Thermacetogeniaceae bacterium]|jgi:flagellar biosynthesis protein|nr:EscU/YscU/HrcU family type III secretion system export apparatus switch protein [Thermoanaerobacterales bacterium]NLN21287.1 flagellar biosynthesis protein FlhB [Syntrophomonadaceae bacterium]HAF17196.1 flagellar biosynthesis protein FlhB [Peptococcaceae bacterium]
MKDDLKHAAAIKYDKDRDGAPRVVASGKGDVARRIVEKAVQYGVPIYQDDVLAELMTRLPLNSEIPPELYEAAAEVLLFVYSLEQKQKTGERG